jgi:hypothetical protein
MGIKVTLCAGALGFAGEPALCTLVDVAIWGCKAACPLSGGCSDYANCVESCP